MDKTMQNDIERDDAIEDVEDQTSEINDDVELEDDSPEEDPHKQIATLNEQRKRWREKAEKLEAQLKEQKEPLKTPNKEAQTDVKPDLSKDIEELKLAERKRQFGYQHGLSPEETDAVFKLNPNPSEETLKDTFVRGGLKAVRAKSRIEQNTPSTSSHSPVVDGKTWSEMSDADRKKNFGKVMQQVIRKG